MFATIEKWQATFLVALAIVSLVVLALLGDVDSSLVVGAIGGIPTLVLGAGAVAHGVRQGARTTAEADVRTDARVERELDRAAEAEHRRA